LNLEVGTIPKDRGEEINDQIIEKAKEFGACLAGIASVEALKKSPSHLIYGKLDGYKTAGNKEGKIKPGEVACPENARSAIIIAAWHPEEKPELGWWRDGSENLLFFSILGLVDNLGVYLNLSHPFMRETCLPLRGPPSCQAERGGQGSNYPYPSPLLASPSLSRHFSHRIIRHAD
jgi:epoxyqueuosine reductase